MPTIVEDVVALILCFNVADGVPIRQKIELVSALKIMQNRMRNIH